MPLVGEPPVVSGALLERHHAPMKNREPASSLFSHTR
jgi:hypothetical protein